MSIPPRGMSRYSICRVVNSQQIVSSSRLNATNATSSTFISDCMNI